MDSQNLSIIQELIYYAESRFTKIIVVMDKIQNDPEKRHRLKWMSTCLREELVSIGFISLIDYIFDFYKQQFILIFIGQVSAIGLAIDIPSVIKSLAENLLFPNTDSFLPNLGPLLRVGLHSSVNDNIDTCSVVSYSFNWWDHDQVRSLTACLTLA
jgi:hypothetical protein